MGDGVCAVHTGSLGALEKDDGEHDIDSGLFPRLRTESEYRQLARLRQKSSMDGSLIEALLIYHFTLSIHQTLQPFIHLPIHLSLHLFIHQFIHPFNSSIHAYTHSRDNFAINRNVISANFV